MFSPLEVIAIETASTTTARKILDALTNSGYAIVKQAESPYTETEDLVSLISTKGVAVELSGGIPHE